MEKGRFYFIILLILISFNLISSASLELTKSDYYQGETLQAELSGYFLEPINLNNFGIYEAEGVHKTPAESGLIKEGTKYFYYAVLPESIEGDYSIKVEDIRYYQNNKETTEPIIENFTISKTDKSYFSFNPGYISASNDFTIKIKSYNKDQEISVSLEGTDQKQTFTLGEGMEKIVYFSIEEITGFLKTNVKINSNQILTLIYGKNKTSNLTIIEDIHDIVKVYPKEINATLLKDRAYDFEILINNEVNYTIEDIVIFVDHEEIGINPERIEEIKEDEKAILNITIKAQSSFKSYIALRYEGSELEIPINIKITENSTNVDYIPIIESSKTCAEAGGVKCTASEEEICTGQTYFPTDYNSGETCCIGKCEKPTSSNGWLWGVLILVLLGVGGFFLYKKAKKNPDKEINIKGLFKRRTVDYNKRMSPEQVNRSLTKN